MSDEGGLETRWEYGWRMTGLEASRRQYYVSWAVLFCAVALLVVRLITGWTWGTIFTVVVAATLVASSYSNYKAQQVIVALRESNDNLSDTADLYRERVQVEGAYRSAWRMERLAKEMYRAKYEKARSRSGEASLGHDLDRLLASLADLLHRHRP